MAPVDTSRPEFTDTTRVGAAGARLMPWLACCRWPARASESCHATPWPRDGRLRSAVAWFPLSRARHHLAVEPHAESSRGCGHRCQVSVVVALPSSSSTVSSHVSWSQPPSRAHVLSATHLTYRHAAAVSRGAILAAHPIYLCGHNNAYRPTCEIGRRGRVVYIGSATLARGRSHCRIQGTGLSAPSIRLAQGFSVQFLTLVSSIGS